MLKSTYRPAPPPPPLPTGWTEHKAPTGHSYYFNAATQQSTYTRPTESQQPQQPYVISPNPTIAVPSSHVVGNVSPMPASFHQGRRFGGNKYHQRQQQKDRPKSKHVIPGCEPWQLVMTKLGRRFVYDPEKNDSFWKFPPHVMKGVVEFDRLEREKKVRGAEQNESKKWKVEDNGAQEADTQNVEVTGAGGDDGDDSEYEEVEVTDEDEDEEGGNPSKRQKTEEEAGDQAMEFNEDDIAYQLAAMGQDYELDPGEYGAGDGEELEEGAEGLELTEEDASDLFKDLLDDFHINPYTPWDKVVEAGQIVEDDRYTVLLNMKSRREVWNDWSREKIRLLKEQRDKEEKKDPRIPYLAFLHTKATPKLYWPEFRRKYMKEPEMRHTKLSDKEREKWYRDYINRLKLPESTLKSDLVSMLKSLPLRTLNRSTSLNALPPNILTDIRFISVRPSVRDPMIETYISALSEAPEESDILPDDVVAVLKKQKQDKERRKALGDRQMQAQREKRRAREAIDRGKGVMRQEEHEIERAMKVGKEGLLSYMEREEQP